MIKANDPQLKSWIEVASNCDFPIQNLPFGIFKTQSSSPRVGIAIGDQVLDLALLNKMGFLNNLKIDNSIFTNQYLNDFIALGKPTWRALRQRVSDLLNADNAELRDNKEAQQKVLQYISNVQPASELFQCRRLFKNQHSKKTIKLENSPLEGWRSRGGGRNTHRTNWLVNTDKNDKPYLQFFFNLYSHRLNPQQKPYLPHFMFFNRNIS